MWIIDDDDKMNGYKWIIIIVWTINHHWIFADESNDSFWHRNSHNKQMQSVSINVGVVMKWMDGA